MFGATPSRGGAGDKQFQVRNMGKVGLLLPHARMWGCVYLECPRVIGMGCRGRRSDTRRFTYARCGYSAAYARDRHGENDLLWWDGTCAYVIVHRAQLQTAEGRCK